MPAEAINRDETMSAGRLWFGFAASVAAWFALGFLDVLIAWRACLHPEQFGSAGVHPGARILHVLLTLLLLSLAAIAGAVSYRNWKKLPGATALVRAEGRERKEFMALAGLFISFTLGAGIVWLGLPLFILQMCIRAR